MKRGRLRECIVDDIMQLEEPNPTVPFFKGPQLFISTLFSEWYLIQNMVRRAAIDDSFESIQTL